MKERTASGPFLWRIAPVLLLALAGCNLADQQVEAAETPARERAPVHIDSILPIEEEIRRFQATVPEAPSELLGGEGSRDALVRRFATALEQGDTATLRQLVISPAEFAYLYYPHTRYTAPPYELPPGLLWFQMQNRGSRGLARALARHADNPEHRLALTGYRCNPDPEIEGENILWTGCLVERELPRGERASERLFGRILERDGRFKFLSYANEL